MTWVLSCGLLLVACGCSAVSPRAPKALACSVEDKYDFLNISNFDGGQTGWFLFADPTPGAQPDPRIDSNLEVTVVPAPGRCGDNAMVELRASGHNFYGTGYGDYANNTQASRANGTGYAGISFWARSEPDTDKTFMLYVDDGRTILLPLDGVDGGFAAPKGEDQDLNGDGLIGPGDIAGGTDCLIPPAQSLGAPACYNNGTLPPATATRVPAPKECGNQFHTYITTTEDWQLFLIPWSQLAQWPCPNRLAGGIDPSDIREIEIKFLQGTSYDVWFDNVAFYRPRTDGGI